MSKIKQYLNSVRCPMCNCGLDGSPWQKTGSWIYCVYDPNHYRQFVDVDEVLDLLSIRFEGIIIKTTIKKYSITKSYHNGAIKFTTIAVNIIDGNGDIIEGSDKKESVVEGDVINLTPFNKEKVIERIKTVLLFQ